MTDTKHKPKDRLTRQQAAEYLGISVSRLAQHRRQGQIGYERNDATGNIRFPFSEVEKLKAFREATTAVVVEYTDDDDDEGSDD
jgi:predicted site-specific integrase-resolvase